MKKTTSLRVDPVTWKKAKFRALELDVDLSDYIDSLIKRDLE